MANLWIKKSISSLQGEASEEHGGLKRTLGARSLVALGIGAIIGAGLFSITGGAAGNNAGPAVTISFVIAAVACGFAGLCYAEFASMIPVAGSAYTYSYATMGEFIAWIIGWDLVLEYAVGAATVSISWSRYFVKFLGYYDIHLPAAVTMSPFDSATLADVKAKIAANPSGSALFEKITNDLRGVKTPEELALVKKAVVISSIAHAEAMRAVKPSMSERELEGIMRYVHDKYGAEEEGYPPIVGAGANGCILHYEENNATEVKNQLVLMDVGAMYHGYSADVTRTFPANGKFTEEQKAIYNAVYDAQEEVFKLCKEGVNYSDLETKTREVLSARLIALGLIKDAKDVGKYYPHGVSHHIGLDVHDKGGYGVPLKAGMVITVEPGIYIPAGSPCDKKWWNIGVRIEDDVQVGKDAGILLSADAPRKWQDVEKTVAEKSIFDAGKFPEVK